MSGNKYEIDVDIDDNLEEGMMNIDTDAAGRLKSAVTKKKGRGFSSIESRGFDSVKHFDTLTEDNVGRAQRSVEGWVVFVTNLHEELTEDDIYDKFADFGPIRELRMPLDHRTGYVKGYALVEYNTYAEAKAAIDNMNGQPLMGQVLACDFAFIKGNFGAHGPATSSRSVNIKPDDGGFGYDEMAVSFFMVLIWSLIVALVKFLGYGVVAEKINGLFQIVFGRSAYAAYIKDWKDLKQAKQDLSSVSAQEEFAKWARLQRKVDGLQASFDKLHASRKRQAMTIEFALSMMIRAAVYVGLAWFAVWKGRAEIVDGVKVPAAMFGPASWIFALPYGQEGELSLVVGLILSQTAFKHIFETVFC